MKSIETLKGFAAGTMNSSWIQEKVIKIDGSSTVYPITEVAANEFQKAKRGTVKVILGISRTGGGFVKFSRGEMDILNASRPVGKKEMEACKESGIKYIELPIAYDGIAVVVNSKNDSVFSMTVADLKKIWEPSAEGKVTRWTHVRPVWPDTPLNLYGPGIGSGTFYYFTEAIVGKSESSRKDFRPCENHDTLVRGIAADKDGLGFSGYAYYAKNKDKLAVVLIDGGNGFLIPSEETVMEEGTSHCPGRSLFMSIRDQLRGPRSRNLLSFI